MAERLAMSNAELADAIVVAHDRARVTSNAQPQFLIWVKHLEALLEIQKRRAAMMAAQPATSSGSADAK